MTIYSYTTLIDPSQGPDGTYAYSINDNGQVTGFYYNGTTYEGFLYGSGTYTTLIDPLQGPNGSTNAYSINDSGQVAGDYYNGTSFEGFVYSNGTYTTLIDPLQYPIGNTYVRSINYSGQAVGFYNSSDTGFEGFLYGNGTYTTLIDPLQGPNPNNGSAWGTWAMSINSSGQVTGYYSNGANYEGFLYSDGTYTTLIDPLQSPYEGTTYAVFINSSGQVTGYYYNGTSFEGFVYSNGIYTTLIDPLQGPNGNTFAQSINDSGQVTGYYYNGTSYQGFVYSNGIYTTLTDPSAGFFPLSINGSGQIVGYYVENISHNDDGFVATPVYDPGPMAGTTSIIVGHNQTLNETALVNGLITPGLPGDTETITTVTGNATLSGSTVTYNSPTFGPDSFTYTVQDQFGDTATGNVDVTVEPGLSITALMPSVVEKGQTTEIGTVTPGLPGDTLTLQQTSGRGTLALQLVNGVEEVIYTAPSTIANILDTVSYTISDQYNDAATESNTVPVAASSDNLYVGTAGQSITVSNGNSAIDGRAGNETITAGNGDNVIFGGPNNALTVGNGDNMIYSGANSSIAAGNGNDAVTSGANSSIKLGNGDDTVIAGANSAFTVGNGHDNIFAGTNDLISIGTGHDTIAFGEGPNPLTIGNESINGFNPAHDILQFNPMLLSNYATAQVGANTVIQINPTNSVTLDNVTATALTASNFHFS
jgi:hypothetical protein